MVELESRAAVQGISLATRSSLMRMLARWENTAKAVDSPYAELFCEVYGLKPEDFGWQERGQATRIIDGERYETSLATALVELANLAGHDVARSAGLFNAPYDPTSLTTAALDWLFAGGQDDLTRTGSLVVAMADVLEIRQATNTFDQLDRQIGGEKSREVAARFLRDRVVPRLRGTCTDAVRREMFAATAVLCEIIGWMAYDTGRQAAGQRYFVQALRMAEAAGDRALGSYILTSLSDQALYLRHPNEALRLARAASSQAGAAAVVLAEAAMFEARSHAQLGDIRATGEALSRAEDLLTAAQSSDRPDWSSPFDEVVFSSHAGTCWVDLGDPGHASEHFEAVLERLRGQARRQLYGTVQLARIAVLGRDIDHAAALGTKALETPGALQSVRSRRHVADLAATLKPHATNVAAREFVERVRTESPTTS
ncbi:hypothetical protein [Catenulispora subtropica]|uniref:hypothetical protein n=1 Tax=Catenulispora subtropica TaxID=450798 RepID=UPI0031D59288